MNEKGDFASDFFLENERILLKRKIKKCGELFENNKNPTSFYTTLEPLRENERRSESRMRMNCKCVARARIETTSSRYILAGQLVNLEARRQFATLGALSSLRLPAVHSTGKSKKKMVTQIIKKIESYLG